MNPPSSTGGASKRHLVLPYAFDTNDIQFFHTSRFLRRRRFCIDVIEAFGWPHREGEHAPKIMTAFIYGSSGGPVASLPFTKFSDTLPIAAMPALRDGSTSPTTG